MSVSETSGIEELVDDKTPESATKQTVTYCPHCESIAEVSGGMGFCNRNSDCPIVSFQPEKTQFESWLEK